MPSIAVLARSDVADAVQALETIDSIVGGMRLAEQLGLVAALDPDPQRVARLLDQAITSSLERHDALTALGAMHAIGRVADDQADRTLARLVREAEPSVAGHAAWVLGGRVPNLDLVGALIEQVAGGTFEAMLAQRTLVQWSQWAGPPIIERIEARIPEVAPAASAHLVVTLEAISRRDDRPPPAVRGERLTVVQPFLHARLDAEGSRIGAGDAGGIASLLRSLGTSLADHPAVAEVVTVTRAHPSSDPAAPTRWESSHEPLACGHRVARIRYGPAENVPLAEAWIHRLAIERELSRVVRSLAGPVVWHLRMADVGTLAATAVARQLGQQVVFTVAPDPHAVMASHQDSGHLDRTTFGVADARDHLWFRSRLVERLAVYADRLVALPNVRIHRDLEDLVGLDLDRPDHPVAVISEGVDTVGLDRAETRRVEACGPSQAAERVLAALPADRRARPWLLTVGRLHPLKGQHRLVEAWAGSPALCEQFNVVVVGGDVADPSAVERAALDLISSAADPATAGLVMIGQLPPAATADLMAHAAANHGVYVAASDKEEFGLAIAEAMGAGMVVVAPERGGASSYIDQGVTGLVTDTRTVATLRQAILDAAPLADADGRREHARAFVRAELSVTRMADRLADLYRDLVSPTEPRPTSATPPT